MRIDGITTCVGELYAGYLRRTLPVWRETLDSLTIVTTSYDRDSAPFSKRPKLQIWMTNVFTAGGASFNKGAALNIGLDAAKPTDWLLSFDCDIRPPYDLRWQIAMRAQKDCINSAVRYDEAGNQTDRRFLPRGYFQLWHVSDPHYRREPVFDEHHKHAGRYDTAFYQQWTQEQWNDLGFKLTHLGEKSTHWYGPGTTREQMREALREARGQT